MAGFTHGSVWRVVLAVAALTAVGCDGRPSVRSADSVEGELRGRVFNGQTGSVVVSAYQMTALFHRAKPLGSAVSDETGSFQIPLRGVHGTILLVATGGSFVDPASGVEVSLEGVELTYVLRKYQLGRVHGGILISPISHWVAALVERYVRVENVPIDSAHEEAWRHLNTHFGGVDWSHGLPFDPTVEQEAPANAASARIGAIVAGISMLARGFAEANHQSPGNKINSLTVTRALHEDLSADGYFDGVGHQGPLFIGVQPQRLDGQTVRTSLALAIKRFLQSDWNGARMDAAILSGLPSELSRSTNPRIFRDGGTELDAEPPRLSWADEGPRPFTNTRSVTLRIRADDGKGSGVAAVYAQNDDGPPIAAKFGNDGIWYATVEANKARNMISVWADDNSSPTNSGRQLQSPYRLSASITFDDQKPSIVITQTPSCYDERALQLEPTPTGIPTVPAVLRPPAGVTKEVIGLQPTHIYKLAPRLSWGESPPTPADLEGTNPNNVPFIRLSVTRTSDDDAPAESATFDAHLTCDGCDTQWAQTGTLIRHDFGSHTRFFYLPIVREMFPMLDEVTKSPARLQITVRVVDAADNKAEMGVWAIYVNIVAPPTPLVEDAAFETSDDPENVRVYRVADSTYHYQFIIQLLGIPAFGVSKMTLYNPYPIRVAVRAQSDGATGHIYERRDWVTKRTGTMRYWKVWGNKSSSVSDHPCKNKKPNNGNEFYFADGAFGCILSQNGKYPHEWPSETQTFKRDPFLVANDYAPSIAGANGVSWWVIPPAQDGRPGELTLHMRRLPPDDFLGYTSKHFTYWVKEWEQDCDCSWGSCDRCGWFAEYEAKLNLADVREIFDGQFLFFGSALRADGSATLDDGWPIAKYSAAKQAVH